MQAGSRSARVVTEIANDDGIWRPGRSSLRRSQSVNSRWRWRCPRSAIQTIGDEKVVFVRTPEGFEKRAVALGRTDDRLAEVVTGLQPGEIIAATNTFLLKAELLKASAED